MYMFFGVIAMLFAICYCILIYGSSSLKQLFRAAGYQAYFFVLGSKGILEDLVYAEHNKAHLSPRVGEVAVITGGARGIGVEVVKKLLQCGIHVVIGCRNVEAGEQITKVIKSRGTVSGEVTCFQLDVGSYKSIKTFAELVLKHFPRIDLLVNNAGIMFVPYVKTEDGFESHFAVNYLGHCLLTHLLLPCIIDTAKEKGTNCRIVNVSSTAHLAGSINFRDLSMSTHYIPSESYAQSKLAQLIFTKSLESKLRKHNIPVQVHAVHPGIVNTELINGTWVNIFAPWIPPLLFKTPKQGAETIVHACLAPALEGCGGSYLSNCRETAVNPQANDQEVQNKLWSIMLSLIGVEKFANLLE